MAYVSIEEIPKIMKKVGDGFYKIKIKKGKILFFSKESILTEQRIEELKKEE